MSTPFVSFDLSSRFHQTLDGDFPTSIRIWNGDDVHLESNATHFVYAFDGTSQLHTSLGAFPLSTGMYAAVTEGDIYSLEPRGSGIVVSLLGFRGMFHLGGPIEERGRLRYIDGCTDTLLIPPLMRGQPCFNHLHIPPHTNQTRHTHPSIRVGMIARGGGKCVTEKGEHILAPGLAFIIAPNAAHSFVTEDESLDVVVYHPDSDTGPTHEDHPMINRTITNYKPHPTLEGVIRE